MNILVNNCTFCSTNSQDTVRIGTQRVCKNCTYLLNRLINVEGLKPLNIMEEATFSLMFFLELDLINTRRILKSTDADDGLKYLVNNKLKQFEGISINFSGVRSEFSDRVNDLIKEHESLLEIYC